MITENDITRLSYLMASIVATPKRVVHHIDQMLGNELPDWMRESLGILRKEVIAAYGEGYPITSTLHMVAEAMIATQSENQTVGRLLMATLESKEQPRR
jgi:hypothetical protein